MNPFPTASFKEAKGDRMKAKRLKTTGDMTPMIDCVFLLLVFFVVSCKFKTVEGHLDVFLPKMDGGLAGPAIKNERQELRLTTRLQGDDIHLSLNAFRIGTYPTAMRSWGVRDSSVDNPARLAEVAERISKDIQVRLAPKLASAGAAGRVVIDVDPEAPYIFAVESMNACLAAGIKDVKFAGPSRRLQGAIAAR